MIFFILDDFVSYWMILSIIESVGIELVVYYG